MQRVKDYLAKLDDCLEKERILIDKFPPKIIQLALKDCDVYSHNMYLVDGHIMSLLSFITNSMTFYHNKLSLYYFLVGFCGAPVDPKTHLPTCISCEHLTSLLYCQIYCRHKCH